MAEMHVLQEQKQAQLRAVQAFLLNSDHLGHGNADNGPSMALSARSASLQRRTGSVLFIPASCRRIHYSAQRLFKTDIFSWKK